MQRFHDPDQVQVRAGELFVVVLSGNGLGGYLWQLAEVPDCVSLHDERDLAPAEPVPGSPGEKEFDLEVTETGRFALRFELRREWERQPARALTLAVEAS